MKLSMAVPLPWEVPYLDSSLTIARLLGEHSRLALGRGLTELDGVFCVVLCLCYVYVVSVLCLCCVCYVYVVSMLSLIVL